jgi:hypothetical protein
MTTRIGKTPREHFTRTADEEFAKFEREERAAPASRPRRTCGAFAFPSRPGKSAAY